MLWSFVGRMTGVSVIYGVLFFFGWYSSRSKLSRAMPLLTRYSIDHHDELCAGISRSVTITIIIWKQQFLPKIFMDKKYTVVMECSHGGELFSTNMDFVFGVPPPPRENDSYATTREKKTTRNDHGRNRKKKTEHKKRIESQSSNNNKDKRRLGSCTKDTEPIILRRVVVRIRT